MRFAEVFVALLGVAQAMPGYPAGHTPCSVLKKSLPSNKPVTPYCQKVLRLPTSTKTSTTYVRPTLTVSCTTTVTTTTTETTTSVPTSTVTETDTVSSNTQTTTVTAPGTGLTTLTCFSQATVIAQVTNTIFTNGGFIQVPKRGYPAPNSQITSACKCLHVPRPTATTTKTKTGRFPTVTVTSLTSVVTETSTETTVSTYTTTETSFTTVARITVTATASSLNVILKPTGIHWAAHTAPQKDGGYQDPEYTKLDAPEVEGIVNNINAFQSNDVNAQIPLYNSGQTATITQYGIVYEGFFVAQTTGDYTFAPYDLRSDDPDTRNDDELIMWSGAQSLTKTWTQSSADFYGTYDNSALGKTLSLQAREVVPVTFYWQNNAGPGKIALFIETPDGVIHSDTSGFFAPNCADS